jgi:hypothetical protein
VFAAYNTDNGAGAVEQFFSAFFDHYFPSSPAQEDPPPKDKRAGLERFSGTYFPPAFLSDSDLTKVFKLGASVSVSVNSDGHLVTTQTLPLPPSSFDNIRWRPVEPLVFSEVDGKRLLVFRQDEHGQVLDLCASPLCIMALQKEPWWNSRNLQFTWIGICSAILLCALIGLPIAAVLQRRQANPTGSKLAHLTAWLASATFAAGAVMVGIGGQDLNWVLFEIPPAIRGGLALWTLELVLSIALVAFTVSAWRRKWWRPAGRVSLTVVCLAALGAALWLHHWNLLGWKF